MIVSGMTADAYHAHPAVGSTTAKLVLESPQLYKDFLDGVYAVPDRPAFQIGRIAHEMVLEPELFAARHVTEGPINERTGKPYGRDTKAFAEWQAEHPDITVVEPWLFTMLERMPRQVSDLLSVGESEVSVFTEINGLGVKARPDRLRDDCIIDLKSIDNIGNIESAIYKRRYHFSAAWYQTVIRKETGNRLPFVPVFAEKSAPWRWRIVDLDPDYQMIGMADVETAIDEISTRTAANDWRDLEPIRSIVSPPHWMVGGE